MKILQMMAGASHGGAEEFFMRLVGAFHRVGLPQSLVIRRDEARAARLVPYGLPLYQLKFGNFFDFQTSRELKKIITAEAPDIVLTWMSRASHHCPRGDFIHVGRLGGYYDLKYFKKCDYLIGNTRHLVSYFHKNRWPSSHTVYLPNFVDTTPGTPLDRRLFDTPDNVPLLLTLGRLHDDKAFDVLIQALASIPQAYLWIGGVGPLDHYLKDLAQTCGVSDRVRFLGWRSDVASLLATCNVFVCPSRVEPLGNVILEAWSHQAPVVAASSWGPRGLITHDHNGLLVPIDDPQAMARQLNRLLASADLQAHLIRNGRLTYDFSFSEEAVVKQYLNFFHKIKGKKRCAVSPATP